MAVAVVDFDKTLVRVDSTLLILRQEKSLWTFSILFWGGVVWLLRFFFPYSKQTFFRRKFRHALFNKIYTYGASSILKKYATILASEINTDVLAYVRTNYDTVYVSTGAWQELVEMVLKISNINWTVIGTKYEPDFKNFFTCWHEEKVRRLQAMQIKDFDAFTDSDEDGPLIRAARKVFWVKDGMMLPYV